MVVLPRFSVDALLETIQRHRVSQFAGVPTLIALLHADTTGFDLTSLRVANSGGAALPSEVLLGIKRKFPNLTILEGYGMSETASGAACNRRNSRKPHSVGKPVWGVQMRVDIVDDIADGPLGPIPVRIYRPARTV